MRRNLLLGIALACVTTLVIADTASAQLFRGRGGRGMMMNGGYGGSNWGYPGYTNFGYGPNYSGGQIYNGFNQPYMAQGWGQNFYGQGYGAPSYGAPSIAGSPVNYQNQAFYAGPGQQNPNAATVHIQVPAPDAQVWIDNQATQNQGTDRLFVSPPLDPNSRYQYHIKARWRDQNGREVTRERDVPVRAGQQQMVSFLDGQQTSQPQLDRQQPVNDQLDRQPQTTQPANPPRNPQQPATVPPPQPDRTNTAPPVDRTTNPNRTSPPPVDRTNPNPNRPNPQP